MAAPTYFTAAGQNAFTTETQIGGYTVEYPLGAAEPTAIVVSAPFAQVTANYSRPAANTLLSFNGTNCYFVSDENFRPFGGHVGDVTEWDRKWASVPASWTEPEEYAYVYPAFSVGTNTSNAYAITAIAQVGTGFAPTYNITSSTANISAGDYVYISANYTRGNQQVQSGSWANVTAASGTVLTVKGTAFSGSGNFTSVSGTVRKGLPGRTTRPSLIVGSQILNDYVLTSTTNIDADLPLLQPFAPVVAITGEATTNLTASTLPTSTAYANLVVTGGSLIVECSRRRYAGNIYRRSTRTIPAL